MRNRTVYKYNSILSFLFDVIALSILFIFFIDLQYKSLGFQFPIDQHINSHYKAWIILLICWYFISKTFHIYKSSSYVSFLSVIRKLIAHFFVFSIVIFAISGLKSENLFSIKLGIAFSLSLFLFTLIQRKLFSYYTKKHFKNNPQKNAIIVGESPHSESLKTLFKNRTDYGIGIVEVIDFTTDWLVKLNQSLIKYNIEYLYISIKQNGFYEEEINLVQEIAENKRLKVYFIPDSVLGNKLYNLSVTYFDTLPVFTFEKFPLDYNENQIVKRVFDIAFTLLIFATLLWWLLPILALTLYITEGSPILFAQKRNGLNGKEFDCLKFRTMRPDKENNRKPTERDDPRVTKLGKILRKTSLDELPQFFNVLRGEMSLVGPRPHMVSENESYSEIINRYALRHYVKPGITGLAQVKGFRGAVDTNKDMEMRIRTDIYYVRNWSFLLDLLIIYKTVKLMVMGDENAI